MTDIIFNGFERALFDLCPLDQLRLQETPEVAAALWQTIDELGYTDALVSESKGGAGLSLTQVQALFFMAGKVGLSLPFGETMMARALLADAGHANDGACIAMARAVPSSGSEIVCTDVAGAALASQVLVSREGEWLLMAREAADVVPGCYRHQASASLRWASADQALVRFERPDVDVESLLNAIHAAAMAGAMDRILAMAVEYANDRRQFGKLIGQFQALQQELAVLAEQVCTAALAARMGCMSAGYVPDRLLAATAKLRASEAATRAAAIGHAVLGAIGITEEHPLGLFTARLYEWRATAGTELRCAEILGEALLDEPDSSMFDFILKRLSPSDEA